MEKFTIGNIEDALTKLESVCDEKELDLDETISQYGSEKLDSLYMNFNEMMAGGAIPESAFTHAVCVEMCEELEKVIEKLNK